MLPLSVVIIAKNEAHILSACLQSVQSLTDDVLVCDTGSTDETKALAEAAGVRVIHENWKGFGITKNNANQQAKYDWILQLDADEALDEQLKASLQQLSWENPAVVYRIRRKSFFLGKPIHYGAWMNDQQIRLFHRKQVAWNSDPVHETLILQPGVITQPLKGNILHNTFQTVKQYEEKMKQYAQKGAEKYFLKGKKDGWWKQIVSPPFTFFRNYIIRFGFLDGKEGFWLAWSTAVYTYNKYKELNRLIRNAS